MIIIYMKDKRKQSDHCLVLLLLLLYSSRLSVTKRQVSRGPDWRKTTQRGEIRGGGVRVSLFIPENQFHSGLIPQVHLSNWKFGHSPALGPPALTAEGQPLLAGLSFPFAYDHLCENHSEIPPCIITGFMHPQTLAPNSHSWFILFLFIVKTTQIKIRVINVRVF